MSSFGNLLSKNRTISVLKEMEVDTEKFRVLYTARTRGMKPERIEAVRAWNNDQDTGKLMKTLGITNQGTAFKLIGQVNDYLRHGKKPSFSAYDGEGQAGQQ